jgi:hypothetical protein
MARRAYWSGHIRLSLVAVPVQVVPATKAAAKISFHQVHKPSGSRIRYQKVVPGKGPVDTEDIVKGYEIEKGRYVLVSDEEIDKIKLEAKKTIDLVQFVDVDEIDPIYFDRPFFVLPDEDSDAEAYVVLREALRKTKKAGLGPDRDPREGLAGGVEGMRQRLDAGSAALCRRAEGNRQRVQGSAGAQARGGHDRTRRADHQAQE